MMRSICLLDLSSRTKHCPVMSNMSTPRTDLPLDDRSPAIKFSYPFLVFISSSFVILRLWNDIRTKKHWYLNVSDWLLVLAQVSSPDLKDVKSGYDLIKLDLCHNRNILWVPDSMVWCWKACLGPNCYQSRYWNVSEVPLVCSVLQPHCNGSPQVQHLCIHAAAGLLQNIQKNDLGFCYHSSELQRHLSLHYPVWGMRPDCEALGTNAAGILLAFQASSGVW